jgi:alkylation response protein AidB-like acyl-CoA dehydrogenase
MVETAAVLSKPSAEIEVLKVNGPGETGWLTSAEVAALTPETVRERVAALRPLIAKHAREAEQLRRPHPAVWDALRATGFLYHFVPKRYGGCEFSAEDFLVTSAVIAESCPSTAWAAAFSVEHNWIAALFPEKAQDEFFAKGRYIVAPAVGTPPFGKAIRVPGGFKLTARWRFASGVMNSNWTIGCAVIEDDAFPIPHWFALHTSDAQVLDTWHVDGLAATGSNDVVVNDHFVPEHMAVSFLDLTNGVGPGSKIHDNALYRMPSSAFLALVLAPTIVGGARGAVSIFQERLKTRKVTGTQTITGEKANFQILLARADLMTRTAELLMRTLGREVLDLARRGQCGDLGARKAIVAQNVFGCRLARDAVRLIVDNSGSSVHFLTDPLQRILRDVNIASSHIIQDFDLLAEQHGREMLGLESATMMF